MLFGALAVTLRTQNDHSKIDGSSGDRHLAANARDAVYISWRAEQSVRFPLRQDETAVQPRFLPSFQREIAGLASVIYLTGNGA